MSVMLKQCKVCKQHKEYGAGQSKAAGFVGYICWPCHLLANSARRRAKYADDKAKRLESKKQQDVK